MSSGILGGIIAAALVAGLTWQASRKKDGSTTAYYGLAFKIVSILIAMLGPAIFALLVFEGVNGNPTATWWVYVVIGIFAAGAISMCVDAFTRRVDWDSESLKFRKWNGERAATWSDIVSIDLKPILQFARVEFKDRAGFAVTEYMTGGRELIAEAKARGLPVTMWGKPVKLGDTEG